MNMNSFGKVILVEGEHYSNSVLGKCDKRRFRQRLRKRFGAEVAQDVIQQIRTTETAQAAPPSGAVPMPVKPVKRVPMPVTPVNTTVMLVPVLLQVVPVCAYQIVSRAPEVETAFVAMDPLVFKRPTA
ncbi:unnamed protein product, partial [Polarella glacialis]